MKKSDEYYSFLNQLAEQIAKEKNTIKEVYEGTIVDCNEFPCGVAIIWKMDHIKIKDWDIIPLKNVAIAIKEGLNMQKFAKDYNIKLKNQKTKS